MNLFPFQEEGVEKMLQFLHAHKSVYLADEMGLGKTAQAIGALNRLKLKKILVVCPSVMKYSWRDEIHKWTDLTDVADCIIDKSSDFEKECGVLIKAALEGNYRLFCMVSYDLAAKPKNLKRLMEIPWDGVVFDEAHYLKSPTTNRTIACLKGFWPLTKYRIALSGTPFLQSVVDGFPIFNKMAPDLFPDFKDFCRRYTNVSQIPVKGRFGTIFVDKYHGVKNAEEFSKKMRGRFFIRRRKDEVMKELPPKIYTKIPLGKDYLLPLPRTEEEHFKKAVAIVKDAVERNIPPPPVPVSLSTQRKAQALKKLPPIIEFTKNLLDQDIPVVVFLYHREVIEKFTDALKGYEPYIITGDTSSKDRASQVRDFQEGGERRLFVLQVKAGGVGITLHRSSTVVFGELDWSPGTIAQATDRVHRIGTTAGSINIYYFVVTGSIDDDLEETIIRKALDFSAVVN